MAHLSLELHKGFTVFYLDSKAPTKTLLFRRGCQIIAEAGRSVKDVLFGHLVDVSHFISLFAFFITSASLHISCSNLPIFHIACAFERNLIFEYV